MGMHSVSTFEKSLQFLIELYEQLSYHLAIPVLGIYLEEMKTHSHTKTCSQMFTTALFYARWLKAENNPDILQLLNGSANFCIQKDFHK